MMNIFATHSKAGWQQPRFGQINLERFYDSEGAQHSYIEINLQKNPYDYYFTHQINSYQSGMLPEVVTLSERYQPQDLTMPTVFSAFKTELLRIIQRTEKAYPSTLDEYSRDELSSVYALIKRPDSYIRKSESGDYFLSIPHSNNALRSLEGLPPPSTISNVTWPPPDAPSASNPSMGLDGLQKNTDHATKETPINNQPTVTGEVPSPNTSSTTAEQQTSQSSETQKGLLFKRLHP